MYASLVRVSDAPSSSSLPDCISLQAPGDAKVITVGRHRLNDVQLDCPRVPSLLSRQHAEIVCDAVFRTSDLSTLMSPCSVTACDTTGCSATACDLG